MKSTDQDEDYLISRAKRNGLSDENGAENVKALSKSWLITARVMYPGQITRFKKKSLQCQYLFFILFIQEISIFNMKLIP